jgi:hypothetical protein
MPEHRKIAVRLDNRTRLMSAVLSATDYPDKSQDRQKHGITLHARGTRKWLAEHTHHPCVTALQVLLDKNIPLEPIYGYGLRLSWPGLEIDEPPRWVPPRWNEQLQHFYELTRLSQWWQDEEEKWNTPILHLNELFEKVDIYGCLSTYFGNIPEQFVCIPNVSYPTDRDIVLQVGGELIVILPPRRAWGDSAPWPYDNDPVYIYQQMLKGYIRLLFGADLRNNPELVAQASEKTLPVGEKFAALHPQWTEQMIGLFSAAAIAIFLEEVIDPREAKAFVQITQRVEGLTILSGVIGLLKRFAEENKSGKYPGFIDYLPTFLKHLRVVKTIAAL